MNKGKYLSTWNKIALTCLNVVIVIIGAVIVSIPLGQHWHSKRMLSYHKQCGLGLYASGKELHDGKGGQVFTCKDTAPQL